MTDIKIEQQLENANNNIKGLNAQLEACKQMLNEYIAQNLQLRTNLVMCAQLNEEANKNINDLKTQLVKLGAELAELKAKEEPTILE